LVNLTHLYKSQIDTDKIEPKKLFGKKEAKEEILEAVEGLASQAVIGCFEMMLHTVIF
jgi:hypothetical protein